MICPETPTAADLYDMRESKPALIPPRAAPRRALWLKQMQLRTVVVTRK